MGNTPWTSNMLFEGVSDKQLEMIEPHIYPLEYKCNEMIMDEMDEGTFAFMVGEGYVNIYKDELKLSEIHSGNIVGLMSLIDESPRSARVIAGEKGVKGFGISKDGWSQIMNRENASIESLLLTNYLKHQQETLRSTNVLGLTEARARIEEEKKRVMSAHFFAQMVLGMVIFTFLLGYLRDLADQTESTYVSFVLLGTYALWSFYYVRNSGISMASFGLQMTNFRSALNFNLKATLVFILLLFVLKFGMVSFYSNQFGDAIIKLYQPEGGWILSGILVLIMYAVHAVFQEFIARACIQGGLMLFISGKWADWKSNILATLMFSSFHIMIDLKFALITIVPGLLWGYLFAKRKNLLAVSISHILIGMVAIFILDLI